MTKKLTAREAREMLLSGCAPIIEDLIICATGKKQKDHPERKRVNVDSKARETVMDAIIPMIQQAGDVQRIRATSTADVLKLIRRGKVTIQEAKELMLIMATDFEVTEIPKMMERIEEITSAK